MIIFSIDGSSEVTINKAIDIIGVVCLHFSTSHSILSAGVVQNLAYYL
mgnify:CR=1 FL=1